MSMSTSVYGIVPPDELWKKMKAVWDACEEAGVDPPKDVSDFFEDCEPDPKGVLILLTDFKNHEAVSEYSTDGQGGFEVDLSKLPDKITALRFVNGW